MKRPMLYIMTFYITGILAGQYSSSVGGIVLFTICTYLAGFAVYFLFRFKAVLLLPLVSVFAFIIFQYSTSCTSQTLESLAKSEKTVEITGNVRSIQHTDYGNKMIFSAEYFKYGSHIINENVKLIVLTDEDPSIKLGQTLKLRGELLELEPAKNPGGFDEKLYYNIQGIEYKAYPDIIEKGEVKTDFFIIMENFKNKLGNIYDKVLPSKEASIIKAMILGDRNNLSEETKNLFSTAGIYHIIAISGLHICIFAGIIKFFAEKIHKRHGKIITIIFLSLYCIFTGGSVSAVRATIMFSIYLFGKYMYLNSDLLTSLGLSCIIILIYQPLYLFDIGFQYSFGAVFSIGIFSSPISRLLNPQNNYSLSSTVNILSSVISVNFITKYITMFYFYSLSFIDIIVNIIIIPFAGIVVFFGFLTGLAGLISINAASFCSEIIYLIIKGYELICTMAVEIPFNQFICGRPDIPATFLYFALITALAYTLYGHIKKKIFLHCSLVLISAYMLLNLIPKDFKITMLDVGQGDSFVVQDNNLCFVIDGGGSSMKEFGKDTGRSVLLPYLKYSGITYLDGIFISHMDFDHAKGVAEIIGYIDIGEIYISDTDLNNELYDYICEKAKKENIPVIKIKKGDVFSFDNGTSIKCLYPYKGSNTEGNSSSLVLKIIYKDTSFLFTGDISENEEKYIISSNANISANVLKLAHHGSKTSNSKQFLEKVNPDFAIVSAGKNNSYSHPSEKVIQRLRAYKIPFINTAESGAATLFSDGKKIYVKTMKGDYQ